MSVLTTRWPLARDLVGLAIALTVASCSSTGATEDAVAPSTASNPESSEVVPTAIPTVAATASETTPPSTGPTTAVPPSAAVTTTVPTTAPLVVTSPSPPTTTQRIEPTRAFPVQDASATGFSDTHSGYPATDIFHPDGCGATLVSPVDGVVLEVRRDNEWDPAVDDPDTRGGRTLAILGDDGVRYYMAHFQEMEARLEPGLRLRAGEVVGVLGDSGRTSACHLHFGLSPVCPNPEWWVRRGVIWPAAYLRDWRNGINTSPRAEIDQWLVDHPDACLKPPGA